MATTTKTLTPTNQTVTLPDMTERPAASVLVDGIGKDADAINALSDKITDKVSVSVTAGTNIVVDQNESYCCGETLVVDFKCHATSAIGGTQAIATLGTPNNRNLKQSGSIVPLIKGTEWGVSGVAYGYINTRVISSNNLSSGDYLHVYFTAFLA